jgi:fatty acid desaturase
MVYVSRSACWSAIALLAVSNSDAFTPLQTATQTSSNIRRNHAANSRLFRPQHAIAVDSDLSEPVETILSPNKNKGNNKGNKNDDKDANPSSMDMTGIAFSGLKGKALSLDAKDFPKAGALRAVIPADCFQAETSKSLGYLAVSMAGTVACTLIGAGLLSIAPPENILTLPVWAAYSAVTGTVAMGLWVLAHECGHGAFSPNKKLQDAIGFIIHSIMLVPYYSWQRSHAVHHQYTNHMELGETHVPEPMTSEKEGSYAAREAVLNKLGKPVGIKVWGGLQAFLHLLIGWPAYLLIGATGGPARGLTNHFYPNPLTTPPQPKRELFPGNWKEKVLKSDIGIAATVGALITWAVCNGVPQVMALYGGPLVVINAWLVIYTWLQHTDVDVPHFDAEDHSFVRGALHTIDRPYDKLDPFGAIDFLHHKIGSTHVAHHFDSTIPHYKADVATQAVKTAFPEFYLYDPTPIPQALWRVCKGCTAAEKRGDKWVWVNQGLEALL